MYSTTNYVSIHKTHGVIANKYAGCVLTVWNCKYRVWWIQSRGHFKRQRNIFNASHSLCERRCVFTPHNISEIYYNFV